MQEDLIMIVYALDNIPGTFYTNEGICRNHNTTDRPGLLLRICPRRQSGGILHKVSSEPQRNVISRLTENAGIHVSTFSLQYHGHKGAFVAIWASPFWLSKVN